MSLFVLLADYSSVTISRSIPESRWLQTTSARRPAIVYAYQQGTTFRVAPNTCKPFVDDNEIKEGDVCSFRFDLNDDIPILTMY